MSKIIPFELIEGEIQSQSSPETKAFISENIEFFHELLADVRLTFPEDENIIAITVENSSNFGVRIDRSESPTATEAEGLLTDSPGASLDEIVQTLRPGLS